MPSLCIYFQVHQPFRLRPYSLFDVGYHKGYFDEEKNQEVCRKVAKKCYLPANTLMLQLIKRYPGKFKIAYSISGLALEQFKAYAPEVLQSFQDLVATGQVELLGETYYHSLSSLFSEKEFKEQVLLHEKTLARFFKVKPTIFRNTELIYSNTIGRSVEKLGYTAMLTEGFEPVLEGKSPNHVYTVAGRGKMKLLLKNYKLSDDIAFRFSDKQWDEYPLTPKKYVAWLQTLEKEADTVNLFMDYETLGEHQWKETGIFQFFRDLVKEVVKSKSFTFKTPSEVVASYPSKGRLSVPLPLSWADQERDLSAWLGNPMQDGTSNWLYQMESLIHQAKSPKLLDTWRKLQTSDHFYYMCTKFWSDGDVHKYFSIYDSPHEAYRIMNSVLTDLDIQISERIQRKKITAPA